MQRRSVRKSDPRYKQLRNRNNESVRKSREKTRREQDATIESIQQLEKENQEIIEKIQSLKDEYQQLHRIFKEHTGIDIDDQIPTKPEEPILSITATTTTEETSMSDNQLDASNLDGSIVLINGVQYKIVSMNQN